MNSKPNPYQAPQASTSAPAAQDAQVHATLVARGKLLLGAILFAWVFLELGLPLLLGEAVSPIRMGLAFILWFAVWRGHGWAITLTAFLFGLGLLIAVASIVSALSKGSPIACLLSLVIAGLDALIVLTLLRSPSLNAFFKAQARTRLDDTRMGCSESPTLNLEAPSMPDAEPPP